MEKIRKLLPDYTVLGATLLIVLLLGTDLLSFQKVYYHQGYVNVQDILAVVLFLVIIVFENFNKIRLITVLNRFNRDTFRILSVYTISMISLLLLMTILGRIIPLLGMLVIILEVLILIFNMYLNFNKKMNRKILPLVLTKHVHYLVLMLVLCFSDNPFTILNIPMTIILTVTYIVLQANVLYSYLKLSEEGEENVR